MNYDDAMRYCLFRFVSGSRAYGTERPDSDEDFRGVFIAPLHCAFDLFHTSFMGSVSIDEQFKGAIDDIKSGNTEGAVERIRKAREIDQFDLNLSIGTVKKPGADEEMHELRKFMKLAAECNPNIIEFLYVSRLITHETPTWIKIREHRSLFLSKKARFTFAGYAIAQLRRIETHRKYLLTPPKGKPTRKEFGLPGHSDIPMEYRRAILSLRTDLLADGVREQVEREKNYHEAIKRWNSYQKWRKNRNPARKAMEEKCGYDAKHAAHVIRLARTCNEILRDGTLSVYRPDRDELRQILNCEWSYERLMGESEKIGEEMNELYEKSSLRKKPDYPGIANLYREICEDNYGVRLS